jgi:hypothetical protein
VGKKMDETLSRLADRKMTKAPISRLTAIPNFLMRNTKMIPQMV